VGDPLVEALASRGIPVSPIQLSTASVKEQLINKLALAIEHGRITLPDDYEYLQEFRDFVYERTAAGGLRMRAAGRGKDDRVLSLAIAWWFVPEESVGHVLVPDNFAIELVEIQDTMGDEALEDMDALPV
jgi:hypothetical protein